MPRARIECIVAGSPRTHERITHVGGTGGGGWRWTVENVIASIEAKTNEFFTEVGGNVAEVGVVHGPTRKHLRTHADGKWNDNLLSLPDCR